MQQIYLFTLSFIVMLSSALSAQNVGIGTASPSSKLEIYNQGTGGTGVVAAGQHFNISALAPNITFEDQSSGTENFAIHLNQNIFRIGRYSGSTSVDDNLVINSNTGNVGIGTASPSQKLDVQGGLVVDNLNDGGASALWVTRLGEQNQGVKIYATDRDLYFRYIEDAGEPSPGTWHFINEHAGGNSYEFMTSYYNGNVSFNAGNVGIGNVPVFKLDVTGDARFSDQVSIPLLPINPEHAASKDYVDKKVAYEDHWDKSGDDIYNNNIGNVGVGTSSPTAALDVKGNIKFDDTGSFPAEGSLNEGDWNTYIISGGGSSRTLRLGTVNDSYTRAEIEIENNNTATGTIKFKTTNTSGGAGERMRIAGNGNVGIGTTNPGSYLLYVNGSTRVNSLNINGAYNMPTSDGTTDYVLRTNGSGTVGWADANSLVDGDNLGDHNATQDIELNNNAIIASNAPPSNIDHLYHDDNSFGGAGGKWAFVSDGTYKGTGNSRLEAGHVYMTQSGQKNYFAGNVGIGHTDAPHKLYVQGGSGFFATNTNSDPLIIARNYKTSNHEEMRIGIIDRQMLFYYLNDETSTRIDFRIHNTDTESGGGASANDNTVMTLEGSTAGGMVGINNTNPSYHLHVNGRIRSNGINETSDQRLKKDFQKLENALEKVQQINGMYYNWKADEYPEMQLSDKKQLGVIAQEIQKVLPEIVDEDEDGYLSVEYGHLTPLLIEAVKELSDELSESRKEQLTMAENNKCEIEKLKDELSLLRSQTKRIDDLEKEILYIREGILMNAKQN